MHFYQATFSDPKDFAWKLSRNPCCIKRKGLSELFMWIWTLETVKKKEI